VAVGVVGVLMKLAMVLVVAPHGLHHCCLVCDAWGCCLPHPEHHLLLQKHPVVDEVGPAAACGLLLLR
jgi:hypothetical protein